MSTTIATNNIQLDVWISVRNGNSTTKVHIRQSVVNILLKIYHIGTVEEQGITALSYNTVRIMIEMYSVNSN